MGRYGHKDWKALARKAANEQDPKKLLAIIEELNEALEERENQVRGRVSTKTEQGNRLLFVDDEASIRLTLPPILQERGFQVQIAASVSEALTAIRAHKFDVLLSDQTSTLTEKAMDSPSSTPCEKPIPIA